MSLFDSHAFFLNDTATTEIYALSLHDALPIYLRGSGRVGVARLQPDRAGHRAAGLTDEGAELLDGLGGDVLAGGDRKSTRLNSSHANISYAVFCLKNKT